VSNQFSGSIGIVDPRTNRQVAAVAVQGDPFRVAIGPEGQKVYATTNLGTLVEIDAETRSVGWVVQLGGNLNGLAVNPAGTRIYVGDVSGKVYELDSSGDVLRTIAVSGNPQGLALSADGRELYVAGEAGDFIVLDLEAGTEVARTPLGSGGFGIALTPDQAQVWVTTPTSGRVLVLDRATRAIVTTILLGGEPRRLAFDRSGRTAVVADEAGAIHFLR
jgi:YVTN family beta-propeller protein